MSDVLNYVCSFAFFASVLRVTTPILFATLGSIVAEWAGASNIALEATMLFAALFGALGSGLSGSLAVGFLCAVLGGLLVTVMLCVFALRLKADIILTGIALNLLAGGGTVFIMYMFLQDKGSTSSIATKVFPSVTIPGVSSIPVLGQILSGHNLFDGGRGVGAAVSYPAGSPYPGGGRKSRRGCQRGNQCGQNPEYRPAAERISHQSGRRLYEYGVYEWL